MLSQICSFLFLCPISVFMFMLVYLTFLVLYNVIGEKLKHVWQHRCFRLSRACMGNAARLPMATFSPHGAAEPEQRPPTYVASRCNFNVQFSVFVLH